MPRWFDGKLNWSIFALVVLMGGAAMLFLSLLAFLWEFDLSISPVWQVGVYHLALALPVFMTFVVASRRPFSFSGGFRRFTMGAAVLVPAALFGGSWALNGPFDGFRDERIFTWVTVSVVCFMLVWMGAIFPYTALVFGRALWRCRRDGVPYDGVCWNVIRASNMISPTSRSSLEA